MQNKSAAVILISHGNFACEALKSVEMIMGKQEDVTAIAVMPGMDLNETVEKLRKAVAEVEAGMNIIIMTDIMGGTPSNAAGILTATMVNVLVITGFNMPMLLEILSSRDGSLSEFSARLCAIGRESIIDLSNKVKKSLQAL